MLLRFFAMGFIFALSSQAIAASNSSAQLMTGQAWEDFCEQLKAAGKVILRDDVPGSELDRAEGYRYLAQQLRRSIDEVLLSHDKAQPQLILSNSKLYKWGSDAADQKNIVASLDSGGIYKLYGTLGTARLTAIQLSTMMPEYRAFGSLSNEQLAAPGEAFEVIFSRDRPKGYSGPWIHMPAETNLLAVREYFYDWETEEPAQMMLVRIDEVPAPPPLDAATMAKLFEQITALFEARVSMWFPLGKPVREHLVNALSPPRGSASQGLIDNLYGNGWFDLQEDQALIITLDAPDALMWSFQLGNFWFESLDYANHNSSVNGHQAIASSDGKYRLVVSRNDPGVPNWLDPAGHQSGYMQYRYQQTRSTPMPTVELVTLEKLHAQLPADTTQVTATERQQEIKLRRSHTALRWSP